MNKNFYRHFREMLANSERGWAVTVIQTFGSGPGTVGIKMLINPKSDEIIGTVGGGSSEKQIIDRVLEERPRDLQIWTYTFDEEGTTDMICGGSMKVLVEPINQSDILYIFGAGHVGIALSELTAKLGFEVVVLDQRKEWANKQKHPLASSTKVIDYLDCAKEVEAKNNYAVIMTHGHKYDEEVLEQLIKLDFRYLGMMGSKSKVKQIFGNLQKKGVSQKELEKVFSPIGVKIGSQTPWELAVSITAELIMIRKKGVE